jgi:hypothetical protein
MKLRSHWPFEKLLAFAMAYLSLAFACHASQARTNAPAKVSPLVTNATPIQVEIPQSVFVIPTSPQEGKDPFFPRSMRLFSSGVVETNVPLATPSVELRLNGISATADRRLAIINNQTFETNEEAEVRTNQGRARIRCLEIKADSVRVQVGGEQRVLHFRPGF